MMRRQREWWVVTFQFETKRGMSITEFYRGSFDECRRVFEHCCDGEDDRQRTFGWRVGIGTVKEWEQFLDDSANDPRVETLYVEAA